MVNYWNAVVQNDCERLVSMSLPWEELNGKNVLVTGATGMIASYLVWLLLYLQEKNVTIKLIALCRNGRKASRLFPRTRNNFNIVIQDVCAPLLISEDIDIIFHFAGNASPYYIKSDPVGIMKANLLGTFNVMELALKKSAKVVFASTREVYGRNDNVSLLAEHDFGVLDAMDDRSCYPESKRAAESLLKSYKLQYAVDFVSVRIAHCYGPSMQLNNDGRIMADILANAVVGKDIELTSSGEAERAFIYITDVISGLFSILFRKTKEVYNLSNEDEPISIKELARIIAQKKGGIQVKYVNSHNYDNAYCSYKRVGLDTVELRKLGWKPQVSLSEGINRVWVALHQFD